MIASRTNDFAKFGGITRKIVSSEIRSLSGEQVADVATSTPTNGERKYLHRMCNTLHVSDSTLRVMDTDGRIALHVRSMHNIRNGVYLHTQFAIVIGSA